MDKKKVSPVVLLDISKAFDSINHEILLNKFQDVSFSPFHITWFNNYLCERHQVIRVNNELSELSTRGKWRPTRQYPTAYPT